MIHNRRRPVAPIFEALETRALLTATVTANLPAVTAPISGPATTVDLSADFSGADVPDNTVFFNLTIGTTPALLPVQLTPAATPLTVANFLSYANSGAYNDSFVHRSVNATGLDIWQGGSYTAAAASDGSLTVNEIKTGDPVANEYAATHPNIRGTIAMAKLGGDPNSATSGWFFNVVDNSDNLDNQNGGFTTFGNVLGASGLAVMDAVSAVPVYAEASPFDNIPLVNYDGTSAAKVFNLVVVDSIKQVSAFTFSVDNPSIVSASISGNTLTYTPGGTAGTAHITVTATGLDGSTAAQTFAVTVADPTVGLLPALKASTVPTSSIAGNKPKGAVTLTLTNTTGAVDKGVNKVEIVAVPAGTTDASTGTVVGQVNVKTNLKPNAAQKVAVPVKLLPATGGGYSLLARTTNAAGATVVASTGITLNIADPIVTPGLAITAAGNTTVAPGKPASFTVTLTNTGNVDATGKLQLTVGLTQDGTTVAQSLLSLTRNIRVKANGKPVVLRLKAKVPVGTAAGAYQLLATSVQANQGISAVSTSTVTVS